MFSYYDNEEGYKH